MGILALWYLGTLPPTSSCHCTEEKRSPPPPPPPSRVLCWVPRVLAAHLTSLQSRQPRHEEHPSPSALLPVPFPFSGANEAAGPTQGPSDSC